MKMQKMNLKQKGFTLIEMAMVLAIIGVLIAGAVKGRDMYYQSKATEEIGDLQFIIFKLQAKYRGVATTAGVTTTTAITGNVFPETMTTTATTVSNQFGGAVTVAPTTISTANDGFTLSDGGLNKTACQNLVGGLTAAVNKLTITNSAAVVTVAYSAFGTLVAYNPAVADAGCSDNGNSVQLVFTKS